MAFAAEEAAVAALGVSQASSQPLSSSMSSRIVVRPAETESAESAEPSTEAPVRFKSANEWASSFFKVDALDGDLKKCCAPHTTKKRCDKSGKKQGYKLTTSASTLKAHLINDHKLKLPDYLLEKQGEKKEAAQEKKKLAQTSLFAYGTKETQEEKLVTAYAINNVPLSLVDNEEWRAAHDSSLSTGANERMHSKKLRLKIIEHDKKLQATVVDSWRGPVALELDGGKSVSKAKLIAFCVIHAGVSYLFKIHDTELEELSGDYFDELIQTVVQEIERNSASVVCSITLDNEGAPNLGVKLLLKLMPWLVHVSCGPHTLELLQAKLFYANPRAQAVCEAVNNFVKWVRNHKDAQKMAIDLQVAATPGLLVKNALVYKLSGNTRKWAGYFIANARVLELAEVTKAIMRAFQDAPQVDVELLPHVQTLLFPIYMAEMVLQRDSSGLLHYAWGYFHVLPVAEAVRRSLQAEADEEAETEAAEEPHEAGEPAVEKAEKRLRSLDKKLAKVAKQFNRCGVLTLCRLLWPSLPPAEREQRHAQAEAELVAFVGKRWDLWQRHADKFGLPTQFRARAGGSVAEKRQLRDDFITRAKTELTRHLQPDGDVRLAQEYFQRQNQEVADFLEGKGEKPARELRTEDVYNAGSYYAAVASSLPLLFFIAMKDLNKCAASEASTERVFSAEGVFHNDLTNRTDNDLTQARVRVKWHQEGAKRRKLMADAADNAFK
jgi:hypothetical protein